MYLPGMTPSAPSEIGSLRHVEIHISLEYTGRSALIHIYGSFYFTYVPFLVSTSYHIVRSKSL